MTDETEAIEFEAPAAAAGSWITPCSRLTGRAGTGKTFSLLARIAEDPKYGVLAASTGIAAVNLGATTIHSLLGFYDERSLKDAYLHGSVQRKLKSLMRQGMARVIIDEDSMLGAEVLDLLVRCFDEVNQEPPVEATGPLGLMLTGDFAQLPPVKQRWAWEAGCWPRFEAATTTLTKVWRQADENFLDALSLSRSGRGADCVDQLSRLGVSFHPDLDDHFDGTTIIPKNDKVDRFNSFVLDRGDGMGQRFSVKARAWGKALDLRPSKTHRDAVANPFHSEFKNVPERLSLRVGAYVMILANRREGEGLVYANGDCGHVVNAGPQGVLVRLVRNAAEVWVGPLCRGFKHGEKPDGWKGLEEVEKDTYMPEPHQEKKPRRYVDGQIEYYPLRLAWASTVHKSQGLSLDRCQIDFRDSFFGQPGMGYTSLSRCRTAEGLRIVGSKETVAARIKIDPRIARWL